MPIRRTGRKASSPWPGRWPAWISRCRAQWRPHRGDSHFEQRRSDPLGHDPIARVIVVLGRLEERARVVRPKVTLEGFTDVEDRDACRGHGGNQGVVGPGAALAVVPYCLFL